MSDKMKTVTKSDHVTIIFGEWFDKTYGNTYYDALVYVGNERYEIPYCYGYNAGDKQSVDESLAKCGYRVRTDNKNRHAPYRHIRVEKHNKLKRELFK